MNMHGLLTRLLFIACLQHSYAAVVIPIGAATFDFNDAGYLQRASVPIDANIVWSAQGWGVRDMSSGGEFLHISGASSQISTGSRMIVTTKNFPNGLEVVHDIYPSPSNGDFVQVDITITNNGPSPIGDLRYRRYIEIDIPGGYNWLTVRGADTAPGLFALHSTWDGTLCGGSDPANTACDDTPVNVEDSPGDFGPTLTVRMENIAAGASHQFRMFYGYAPNKAAAVTTMEALDPDMMWIQGNNDGNDGDQFLLAYASGGGAADPPAPDCSQCSPSAFCGVDGDDNVLCTCATGFMDVYGNGTVCDDINECALEADTQQCDRLAYCENKPGSWACVCPEGYLGDGMTCLNDAFGIRIVATIPGVDSYSAEFLKIQYASIVTGALKYANDSIVETMPTFTGDYPFGGRVLGLTEGPDSGDQLTMWALFASEADASLTLSLLSSPDWSSMGISTIEDGPEVYRWYAGDNLELPPTGLSVDSVYFDSTCLTSGCWKVDVTYTKGLADFNVFFLPLASAADTLSYDPVYTDLDSTWQISPAQTFLPAMHPCTSMDYDASSGNLPASITACCISEFQAMYRPVAAFNTAITATGIDLSPGICGEGDRVRPVGRATVPWFVGSGQTPVDADSFAAPISASEVSGVFVDGVFAGMPTSNIYHREVVDAYVGIYKARLELDEVELRTLAGQRRGTVGVEHTVDTFVGLVNFSPTGGKVLDTGAVQVGIHLEKTSFFTVSTHGTNDYTFLEYVNLRLVAVYEQDKDFSGSEESGDRTVRTDSNNQANYLQVTFTLGSQYNVDPAGSPLIPSTSVRAGHGTFFDTGSDDLLHMCTLWGDSDSRFDATSGTLGFSDLLTTQDCAPAASMCESPSTIPDSFVVYNIPLGMDYFEGTAGGASPTLANNIFVEMVVSAAESGSTREVSGAPNEGSDPMQMKTTLTASIPIVEGGINIFCDGFTAKTDLEDVADADIVVGSASDASELSRLRILKDIASTQMNPNEITEINSDSIEAGLMTLVLKGNASYFGLSGRDDVTIELEDVITIHIMEDTGSGVGTSKDSFVLDKLNDAPDDNLDSSGLITDGYCLNGAFCFEIDRASQRAHLEPTPALLAECPFNPPRPEPGAMELETCVMRRDVRYREFPARTGAFSTAMEICAGGKGSCGAMSDEQWFFTTIFGDDDYAKSLATSYANVIANKYDLNGVYRRAYWVNPGYEWTPTQTGGTPIFSVSQKLYLFALVTLDEGLTDPGNTGASLAYDSPVLPGSRRRMLLQSTPSNVNEALQDGQSEVGGGVFEFQTSPSQLMAKTFKVPEERVATFKLQLQLTEAEACMSTTELQSSLRLTLSDYLTSSASPHHTVQVVAMSVDKAGVQCRRSIRSLLSAYSAATADVTMMVVFKEGQDATISLAKLQGMAGVQSAEPLSVSPSVDTTVPADDTSIAQPSDKKDTEGGSSNVALIAGAAAAGVVAVATIIAGVYCLRKRNEPHVISAVQSINVEDLKSQLASEA